MQAVYDLLRWCSHIPPKRPHAYNSGFTAPVRCRSLRPTCSLVTPLAEKKLEFQLHLDAMNVSATSLFPGIDGVGRRINELVGLHKRM